MRRRRPPILATVVAVAALALLVAACGSNASSSSASGSSGSSGSDGHLTQAQVQQEQQDAVRFAACMRTHGVSNFPDPTSPRTFKEAFSSSAAQSPAFQSAADACGHLLPGGGPHGQSPAHSQRQVAAALAFARCIRTHGFPNFPDPTSSGDLTHQMLANAGIDLHQPAVLQAGDACVGVTHGFLTKASVARFVAGQ